MSNQKKYPDFFIVGAPKSGTTALDNFLAQHPEIFMAKKELHYFGKDLEINQKQLSAANYLSFFDNAKSTQLKGEASVWYLYSSTAAEEIKQFNPAAKIIILLRNPTEMIPSLHGQYIFNGDEKEENFEKAFFQDLERKNEPNASFSFKSRPTYINSVLYAKQVERYFNTFGKENVLVILHDELKNNFNTTYQNTLSFLDVDTSFIPEQEQINTRRNIKNSKLHQLSKNPSNGLKKLIRFIVPFKKIRHSLMKTMDNLNVSEKHPKKLSTDLKEKIISLTKEDVQKLASLINKDLAAWLK